VAAVRYDRDPKSIFTFDLQGRNRRLEIRSGLAPDWSPNGRMLAYEARNDIYLYDFARRRSRRLTHSPPGTAAGLPSWAPNGRRIAFSRRSGQGDTRSSNVFTIGADGSGLRQVTHNRARGPIAGDSDPSWSPDGRLIAFVHAPDNDTGYFISVIAPNGSDQRNVTGPPGSFGGVAPDWGRRPG
jgi:Tol biopolymer transport system component